MKTPKSKFIKNKIKGLEFNEDNRDYIRSLIELEEFIINGPSSMSGNYRFNSLKEYYKKEWLEILRELKPKNVKKELEKFEKIRLDEEKESKRLILKEKREYEKDQKMWKKLGGKIDVEELIALAQSKIIIIKEIIEKFSGKKFKEIPIEKIIDKAAEKGIDESKVEEAIDYLMKSGDIYKPKENYIKRF